MRFHLGPPPSAFVHSPGWTPLVEPSPTRLARAGLVLGLCLGAGVSGLWHGAGIPVAAQWQSLQGLAAVAIFLVSLVGLFALHEAVHTLVHPGSGFSPLSVVGASRKPLLLYASYLGPISRTRFAAVLVAPFGVLSLLPAAGVAAGLVPHGIGPQLAVLAVANALASGVDGLGVALLWSQVPPGAQLQNDGWQTYWRRADA